MTFPTRWGPLRHTNFRWFFFGETINTAGSSMSGLALAFAVLHIDNSPTALGVVVAAWTVPMVGFMLIGGALADRLPRALVLRGCNLIEGVTQLISAPSSSPAPRRSGISSCCSSSAAPPLR